jgi:hypothetical protein
MIAFFNPDTEKAFCEIIYPPVKFGVCKAKVAIRVNQKIMIGMGLSLIA